MNLQLPPEIEQRIIAAAKAGDYDRVAEQLAAAIRSEGANVFAGVTPNGETSLPVMPGRVDIDELSNAQGVAPFNASHRAPSGVWPDDESTDDFLAFLKQSRNEHAQGRLH